MFVVDLTDHSEVLPAQVLRHPGLYFTTYSALIGSIPVAVV